MPSYRLIGTSGEDLGSLRAAVPNWRPGDRLQRGNGGDAEAAYLDRTAYWVARFRQAQAHQPYARPT